MPVREAAASASKKIASLLQEDGNEDAPAAAAEPQMAKASSTGTMTSSSNVSATNSNDGANQKRKTERNKKDKKRNFSCDICGKKCKTEKKWQKHLRKQHQQGNLFVTF